MTSSRNTLSTHGKIQILPEVLANRIAAGEVVERPASLAKELIENALDAEATEITVAVKKAGLEELTVSDNGWGIAKDELELAFRRHATSKISTAKDLQRITHLGFRGEALPSIASVARIEAISKCEDQTEAYVYRVEGGKPKGLEPAARENGTTIRIRSLFYNVPARRKFLRTGATEYGHVVTAFKRYAIAYPELKWTLIKDDKTVLSFEPTDLQGRIKQLFDIQGDTQLHEVDSRTGDILVHGFVGGESLFKRSRGDQFLFVNRRPFQSTSLHHAVINGYGPLIHPGQIPFYVLFLRLDPEEFDVNVHPAKHEVRFRDEGLSYRSILVAVRNALGLAIRSGKAPVQITQQGQPHHEIRPDLRPQKSYTQALPTDGRKELELMFGPPEQRPVYHDPSSTVQHREEPFDPHSPVPTSESMEEGATQTIATHGTPAVHSSSGYQHTPVQRTNIWQLHNMYILSQVKSGLVVIDQHVAHERILFERAIEAMHDKPWTGQQLLFPAEIVLDTAESELLSEIAPTLLRMGMEIEQVNDTEWLIKSVPSGLKVSNEAKLLREILEDYQTHYEVKLDPQERLAASFACKAAIKAGDPLKLEEMNALIDELFLTKYPFVCPHGRPVVVNLTLSDLHKLFGRE